MTDTAAPTTGAVTPTTGNATPPADTPPADTPEGARWRGYSHKELYLMLHDGPGAGASASPSRRWAEISTTLTEIGQDLKKALDLTGSGWQGKAAGAAYDRLSTTVMWATEAGAGAGIMRTAVEDQGDHIAKARADMPAPEDVPPAQPDPTVAPAAQVLQTQVDAETAEATASSAEERAVEVMTAYETNAEATTAALASFEMPQKLLPSTDIHRGHGGGLLGILPTVAAGLLGPPPRHDDRRNDWRGNHGRDNWNSPPSTGGSSSHWNEPRRHAPQAPPAPGKTTGVSTEPLLAPRSSGSGTQERAANRGGGSANNASGGGHGGGVPQKTGVPNLGVPTAHELQQQAAAASQAAAGAHPGAGAPVAPTAGAAGGGQDKTALRRFGMDAIGSSQWFGDNDEPAVGESPKRRFDLRQSADVTESVSILDEEHQLPPTVIGDGGR